MALRIPYDFEQDPIPDTKEKLVSVADPLGAGPGASTFYLSRRFEFTEGTYTFILAADDAATLWLGTNQFDSRIVVSCVLGSPGVNPLYIPQGQYRIDVILQNLPPTPTPCYFTLVIKRGDEVVYASDKEGWWLDDAAISDDDLPPPGDIRFKLPVFSVLPNWADGVTERLVWQTDVMGSETDAEQRRSVRRNARRHFEASFLRQRMQRNRLDSFFAGVGSGHFMLPIWHEQVRMEDGIDLGGAGVVLENLALREFRKGDLVFVNNGDPDDYDILQVGDMEAHRFSWAFPPPRTWPVGTRIYPMRMARISTQPPQMSNITDRVARAQVLFDMVEPYYIEPSWGANLGGEPLFRFDPEWSNGIDVDYGRKAFVIDNQTGLPVVVDHGKYTTTTSQAKLRLYGRSAAHRLRQFLQAARGRSQKFQCPTFTDDVYPLGDVISGTEILIHNQGFRAAMAVPQPLRIRLAFQFYDAPTIYRDLVDARTVRDGLKAVAEVIELDEALPEIEVKSLKRISFISDTRFEQDQFEIYHHSSNQVVIDVAIVLRQFTDKRIAK